MKLTDHFPGSSKNTLRAWLREGRILVDGVPAKSIDLTLSPEARVTLAPKKKFAPRGLTILHEDEDLVVIDKPAGLLSVALDRGNEANVHTILKRRFHNRRVFPVHRLDKGTSGILVFAYTEKARDHLRKQFEAHTIERVYYALVKGNPPSSGTWTSYLMEDKNTFVRKTTRDRGRLAITHYEVVKSKQAVSLLKLKLETGRKNQIRVQAHDAGFPVIGDEKYAPDDDSDSRLCLHASRLAFTHPATGKTLSFTSPYPTFFDKIVAK